VHRGWRTVARWRGIKLPWQVENARAKRDASQGRDERNRGAGIPDDSALLLGGIMATSTLDHVDESKWTGQARARLHARRDGRQVGTANADTGDVLKIQIMATT
jgi:hypothetical protein